MNCPFKGQELVTIFLFHLEINKFNSISMINILLVLYFSLAHVNMSTNSHLKNASVTFTLPRRRIYRTALKSLVAAAYRLIRAWLNWWWWWWVMSWKEPEFRNFYCHNNIKTKYLIPFLVAQSMSMTFTIMDFIILFV